MSTAEILAERAVELAGTDTDTDAGVQDLLECCADKRVSVVMAKRSIEERIGATGGDPSMARAVELLDETLHRGPWGDDA
jgi:hypothetical protein